MACGGAAGLGGELEPALLARKRQGVAPGTRAILSTHCGVGLPLGKISMTIRLSSAGPVLSLTNHSASSGTPSACADLSANGVPSSRIASVATWGNAPSRSRRASSSPKRLRTSFQRLGLCIDVRIA